LLVPISYWLTTIMFTSTKQIVCGSGRAAPRWRAFPVAAAYGSTIESLLVSGTTQRPPAHHIGVDPLHLFWHRRDAYYWLIPFEQQNSCKPILRMHQQNAN
jgi:hypothetical protein